MTATDGVHEDATWYVLQHGNVEPSTREFTETRDAVEERMRADPVFADAVRAALNHPPAPTPEASASKEEAPPARGGRAYWFPRRGDAVERTLVDVRWLFVATVFGGALGVAMAYVAGRFGRAHLSPFVAAALLAIVLAVAWGIRRGDDLRVRMAVTVGERASVARVEKAEP